MKKYSGQADDKKEYSESRVSDSDKKKNVFSETVIFFIFKSSSVDTDFYILFFLYLYCVFYHCFR